MAYMAIPTLNTGETLTALHLNILAQNAQHLHDLMQQSNVPCPSFHRTEIASAGVDYTFRHRLPLLRYRIANVTGTLNYYRIFYNGRLVIDDEDPMVSPYTGVVNLHAPSEWPNYAGAWNSGTSYYENINGDGSIVLHGGTYYVCIDGHSGGKEPGVETSYWTAITIPVVGSLYVCTVTAAFSDGAKELAIEYVYEDIG